MVVGLGFANLVPMDTSLAKPTAWVFLVLGVVGSLVVLGLTLYEPTRRRD
jgi:hypothetical protein